MLSHSQPEVPLKSFSYFYFITTYAIIRAYFNKFICGALAHLVERFNGIEEVTSSILVCSTILKELGLALFLYHDYYRQKVQ